MVVSRSIERPYDSGEDFLNIRVVCPICKIVDSVCVVDRRPCRVANLVRPFCFADFIQGLLSKANVAERFLVADLNRQHLSHGRISSPHQLIRNEAPWPSQRDHSTSCNWPRCSGNALNQPSPGPPFQMLLRYPDVDRCLGGLPATSWRCQGIAGLSSQDKHIRRLGQILDVCVALTSMAARRRVPENHDVRDTGLHGLAPPTRYSQLEKPAQKK